MLFKDNSRYSFLKLWTDGMIVCEEWYSLCFYIQVLYSCKHEGKDSVFVCKVHLWELTTRTRRILSLNNVVWFMWQTLVYQWITRSVLKCFLQYSFVMSSSHFTWTNGSYLFLWKVNCYVGNGFKCSTSALERKMTLPIYTRQKIGLQCTVREFCIWCSEPGNARCSTLASKLRKGYFLIEVAEIEPVSLM